MTKVRDSAQNVHYQPWRTLTGDDGTGEWLPQWRDPAKPSLFSVAVLARPDQLVLYMSSSLAVFPTRCDQLNSDLANLGATVEVG